MANTKINSEWGELVRGILAKYELTLRDAEGRTGVDYTTIQTWAKYNKQPSYDKARSFLAEFADERIRGMLLVGYSPPLEWLDVERARKVMAVFLEHEPDEQKRKELMQAFNHALERTEYKLSDE